MSAAHTSGPWHSGDPSYGYFHIYSNHTVGGELCKQGRQAICTAPSTSKKYSPLHHEMFAANTRLIAAAPDMLQALRRAVLALAFAAESSPAMQDDYEAVSAAIAKATGETT